MYARDKTRQGGAGLADLRRPVPQALRPPAIAPRALPEEAARERQPEAGVDARRPRHTCAASIADGLAATVERFNEHAAQRRRPRLRAGRVRLQPGARRPATAGCTRASARSTRRRTTPCRCCRPTSAPAAASSPTSTARVLDEYGRTDRRAVRDRQQHGDGDGPALPRPRREHRQQHGVRLPRRPPGGARGDRAGGRQCNVTPSRRTVIARVGHRRAAETSCASVDRVDIDHRRDAVVVEVERTDGLVHAVARPHARVAVDVHFDGHGRNRTTSPTRVRKIHAI